MKKETQDFKKGDVVYITSDYNNMRGAKILKDFVLKEVGWKYLSLHRKAQKHFYPYEFVCWLFSQDYIEDINVICNEMCLGNSSKHPFGNEKEIRYDL